MKIIDVDSSQSGQRLDKFLRRYFRNAGSGFLYRMLRKKNIVLNGAKASGSEVINPGDQIKVFFSDETFDKMRGTDAAFHEGNKGTDAKTARIKQKDYKPGDINIVYEDEDILVMNKPAGLLTQGAGAGDDCLNLRALNYLFKTGQITDESYRMFHPSVVNRLDRNTSGLVLFGKTLHGTQLLSEELRDRTSIKIYHCITFRNFNEEALKTKGVKYTIGDDNEIIINGFLKKDNTTNTVVIKDTEFPGSKPIKTGIRPMAIPGGSRRDDISYLSVRLYTGRTHQIRAHLAHTGFPVVFDPKYGNRGLNEKWMKMTGLHFQMLHSYSFEMSDGRKFTAEEPEAFARILKA